VGGNAAPREADTKQVGIWIRVSTEDQVKGESPEHHERRAHAYAEAKGWRVREVYRLEAVSGKSVMGHPETERMLGHVRSAHITGLIFSKLARLARNTRELLEFSDIFREHDADLISLHESIDTSSPAGRLLYRMIASLAEWEREEIAERVAASVPIRAKLGKPLGGAAPFGFQWKDRALVPDPKEAPIRREMYELFREHQRVKTVAHILNERGYRTRNGSKFSNTTITRLLQDPSAKGVRRANYTRSLGTNKKWAVKPESDWVLTSIEPIISEELWETCDHILTARRENGKPRTKRARHLFAGYVSCHCGQKMYVPSVGEGRQLKYVCQTCRNKIAVGDLEAIFQEQLKDFFFSPEEVAAHVGQADAVLQAKEEALRSLETEEQKVRREMAKLLQLYQGDQISPEGFGREYRPKEERLGQLQEEVPRLLGEVDFLKVQLLSRDEVLAEARDLYARWSALEEEEKRQIVESITQKIVVGKEDVEIDLCYLPSPSQSVANGERNLTSSSRRRVGIAPGTRRWRWRAPAGSRLPRAAGAVDPGDGAETPAARRERERRAGRE